jgi:putative hydrolase of the HAD superfamily
MRTRAVFLDLDATLLDYDEAAWAATVDAVTRRLSELAGAGRLDAGRLATVYAELSWRHFAAAEKAADAPADGHAIWRELWRDALADCDHGDNALADQAAALYAAERAARYRLYSDVLPALGELRDRVGALVLITNGPGSTQRHKAEATGLTSLLDAVIISGEAGVTKPDPAIFDLAAQAAGVPLAAAWHVGDSLTSDIAGARNAGLGAGVWLNRSGAVAPEPRPDSEITSLSQLPPLLDRAGLHQRPDR